MSLYGINSDTFGITTTYQGTTDSDSGTQVAGMLSGLASTGLSAIGLGFLSPVLDGLIGEIGANIDAMLKYGFSSWGASWTPEKAKAKWGETVLPLIKTKVQTLGEGNIDENINSLYLELQGNYQTYNRLSRTFDARSSREAMTWAKGEIQKLISKVFDNGIIPKLREKGVKVNKVSFQSRVTDIQGMNYLWELPLDHIETYTFYKYEFDVSNVKIDKEGNVTTSGGGGMGLLGLAGIGLAIFKGMK